MYHAIVSVREEGGDIPTQTREQQVANYVGPTLTELGLAQWMVTHGGMVTMLSPHPSLSSSPPSFSLSLLLLLTHLLSLPISPSHTIMYD
jgi:hypothetical protein